MTSAEIKESSMALWDDFSGYVVAAPLELSWKSCHIHHCSITFVLFVLWISDMFLQFFFFFFQFSQSVAEYSYRNLMVA